MSRKITKSNLSRDEISLLINSEEAKNKKLYGNLYEVLLLTKELKAVTLEELEDRNLDYYGISALSYNKQTLIDNATKEWRATTDIIDNPERIARCQLCNAPNLRYECHIRNIKNDVELLVGSECVTKFKIDGYLDQKKQLAEIHKGHKIVQRRNEFYSHFPECENYIIEAEKFFVEIPILLPYNLFTSLQNVIKRMRLIYFTYINDGKKPFNSEFDSFKLFELAMKQYDKLKKESNDFVTNNEDKEHICKRREIDWLISNNKNSLLQQIAENNGIYTFQTLKYVYSPNLIHENKTLFVNRNQSQEIKLDKIKDSNMLFSLYKFGYQPNIIFSAPLSIFMKNIGAKCIIDKCYVYGTSDILNISSITNLKSNLFSILNYIDNIMFCLGCVFLFDDSTNTLLVFRKGDRAIKQFNPYGFMKDYSKYIILTDKEIKRYLFSLIKKSISTSWISQEIQSKQGINDKISKLYKIYTDSHSYYNYHISKDNKFEIVLYKIINRSAPACNLYIDFDNPKYGVWQRNNIKIGNNKLNSIDYALLISDNLPYYQRNDILFIQITSRIKNNDIIFYISNNRFNVIKCKIESEEAESESIFKIIKISKRNIQTYGKIIYCLRQSKQRP